MGGVRVRLAPLLGIYLRSLRVRVVGLSQEALAELTDARERLAEEHARLA